MKPSKYNVVLEDGLRYEHKVFNLLTNQYITYGEEDRAFVRALTTLEATEGLEIDEARLKLLVEMKRKGVLIEDDLDELDILRYREKERFFQNNAFHLVIQPTRDCNFRCTYCYEAHESGTMSQATMDRLLQFVARTTQQVKKLVVTWFGGEPTLTLEEIRYLSEGIIASCEKNNCAYEALMVTNGYLLDEETLNFCRQNGIERFQITIDGTEAAHDSLRPLENGEGTFSRIEANLLNLLNHDVELVLRVNVNAMNYQSLDDVLDIVPAEHRHRVSLSLVNVFQNASKFRLYDGYVKALEKGYDISFINLTKLCTECRKNAMTVEPDGDVVFCSMAGEAGIKFGKLTEDGILAIVNQSVYYKFKTLSAFDSVKCRTCDEAPWCLGGCRLARLGNAQFCVKERGVDLTVRDKIKLSLMSANG